MKKQVRKKVFETNSSSMHSIVVTKNDSLYNNLKKRLYLTKDGTWNICDDDLYFGRSPFQCLSTFESKTRYAIASLCGWNSNAAEKFEEIKQIVLETIPECKNIKLPKVYHNDKKVCYGSVDEDILSRFLEKNNISLKDFLLDNKYKVIVDGDEYCIYDELKKSNLINKENIVLEYPERN